MQPVDHDPLQFGPEETSHADDLPAAYGSSSTAEPLGSAAVASAPPLPQPHDPLAPATANSEHNTKHTTWHHYPDPGPAAATSAPASAGASSDPAQPDQHQAGAAAGNGMYPNVPTPANYPISLGSAGSGSLSGSAQGTPHAGAAVLGGLATAISALPSSNPELRISVGKPLRHMGPSGIPGLEEAYITYDVTTATSLPHFSGTTFSVRRRFRDVVSLSNLLPKLLHGSFLPARPEKNLIEGRRMTDGFIEARRAALERYLNRLAAHPAAGRSEVLRVFLEADGNLRSNPQWRALKPKVLTTTQATSRLLRSLVGVRKTAPTPSEVVQPAAACRDVYRMLHENLQQLRGSFKHSPLSAEEVAMRDDTSLVEDAAAALHVALHRAEAWSRLAGARAGLLGEASVALAALATFEGSYAYSDTNVTQATNAAAQAAQAASSVSASGAAAASSALQPLREHHAATPNVLGALHMRERQLLTVMTLRQDLEDKRAQFSAAQLTPASQAKRVDTLRSQVSQLEVSAVAAEAEYSRQLGRNREELNVLKASRSKELTAMMAELAGLMLQQQQQESTIWNNLLQKLPQPQQTTAYMVQRDLVMAPLS